MEKGFTKKSTGVLLTAGALFFSAEWSAQKRGSDSAKVAEVEEVVVLGSRGGGRSKTDSPVPVDVFNLKAMAVTLPQTNLNQMLNVIAPSFTSTVQTNADGTDHLDPAQLRGLGPDQALVLVNGKRRHTSALVNVNGAPGRGTVGTDLNAIPAFALSRIEVLRDGASAQYGSDAISGVMNLTLKRDTGKLTGQITAGANPSYASNDHTGGIDGETFQVDLNYGAKIGNRGGFFNVTWSSQLRERTYRAGTESGALFNAYNAIERRALENGVNLSSLFTNINTTSNASQLVGYIQQYAKEVAYFSPDFQNRIAGAAGIAQLQSLLGADYTDQELAYRGLSRKDFNMQVGQSKLANHQFFINMEAPVSGDWKVYAFGGYGYRQGTSGGFYRRPNQSRTFTGLYSDGYVPQIQAAIQDLSLASGLRGSLGAWKVDFSNTFGQNHFDYNILNTGNTSLRFLSPSSFYAGGLRFTQNTLNLDVSRSLDWLSGANLAFGAEQRTENFKINAGEPASYLAYDVLGNERTFQSVNPTDFFGNVLPGGSQVFSGFRAANAVNENRYSVAGYADLEVNATEAWLVNGAVRFENYSDFGSTFNYKLATRYKFSDRFNLRAAGSTGFRAPSIHQIYYNMNSTMFLNGELYEVGTFSNVSPIARLLGIPKLKQETSKSLSAGLTYRLPSVGLTFTADAYFIRIDDRIVLTDQFSRPPAAGALQDAFDAAEVNAAQLFANAIDTETRGIDVVVSHHLKSGNFKLNNNLALNLNRTRKVGGIHASDLLREAGLESVYFSERSRVYLEEAVPRFKASLSHEGSWKSLAFYVRNSYFGKVTGADGILVNGVRDAFVHQIMQDRVITDVSVSFPLLSSVTLTVGANNVFDVYPSKNVVENNNNDQFVYTRSTSQFGLNGRYVFGRLNFSF
ncbi:TonB-dependent receptor plug domain-containing protein [Bergeyella sp. RCAD1439]|uniref:TonB-dependent receptor plug domain-containing protein n=1 Tax=Bergeyella anatis TaxID=3113737 RepID=UPI002E182424|nr:TonB-dependent receptor [Bergeyella sp. RCAD1439]